MAGEMISPCIGICSIRGGVCRGCGRTPEQIQGWAEYTDEERREIMGQDNGLDVSPSWLELRDERDRLRRLVETALEDGTLCGSAWEGKARAALKEVSDADIDTR